MKAKKPNIAKAVRAAMPNDVAPMAMTLAGERFKGKIVEATRIELVSKHILQKSSTCLFYFSMSGINWEQTTDQFLSWISR